jgi:hypothetical protein
LSPCLTRFVRLGVGLLLTIAVGRPAMRADEPKPIRALLIIGGCCHDYTEQ